MKALLQRVTGARVSVAGEEVGRIGQGLVVFVGVASEDTERDVRYLVQKTVNLRIFADEAGKFNRSALDISGELLLVSQFTLLADTREDGVPVLLRRHHRLRLKNCFWSSLSRLVPPA